MKTRNNVQKTALKSLAVLFSVLILSYTVSAQNFWKKVLLESSFNDLAVALIETDANAEASSSSSAYNDFYEEYLVEDTEEALEVEEWMTNSGLFEYAEVLEVESENPLEVEEWMLSESNFTSAEFYLEEDTDEALEIEDWMLKEGNFTTQSSDLNSQVNGFEGWNVQVTEQGNMRIYMRTVKDSELQIENWMIDEKYWN